MVNAPLAHCGVCKHRPLEEGGYGSCFQPEVVRVERAKLAQHDCPRFEYGSKPERIESPSQEEALF